MDKLTRQQEDIVCELLHHCHQEEIAQYILQTIGEHHWTRSILSSSPEFLTEEQEYLYDSLGGGYDADEIDEEILIDAINEEIVERLKAEGVIQYLYENEDYINAIREGEITHEDIDIEDIKTAVYLIE